MILKIIYKFYTMLINGYNKLVNLIFIKVFKVEVKGKCFIRGKLFLRNSGKIIFGDKLVINSGFKYNPIGGQSFMSIVVEKKGLLKIKNNVGMSNSTIYCANKITIEENVFIGGNCKIYDTNFHSIYLKNRLLKPEIGVKTAPVKICKGVFIGAGTIILKGVTIGENSVIGAGSVVSKSIPANEVWAGNEIKFIKRIIQ